MFGVAVPPVQQALGAWNGRQPRIWSKASVEEVYMAPVRKEFVDLCARLTAFNVQMVLDACATEKPTAVNSLLVAINSAIAKITDDYGLLPKVKRLGAEFVAQNWKGSLDEVRKGFADPKVRAKYYWDVAAIIEAQKAKSAKKPKRRKP